MASHEGSSRTFIGTVVCVDLVGYSKRPVDRQTAIKAHFNKLLAQVLAGIRPEDRIILDTGDGVAISFLGDPRESLDAGLAIQRVLAACAGKLGADDGSGPVRIGINLGPVKVAMDMNGRPNIIGDGINVATCIMGFAKPGQIAVSRSFHDMLSRMSEAYAALFRFDGVRTDANVREHEVYVVRESALESRRAAQAGTSSPASSTRVTGAIASVLRDRVKVGIAAGLLLAVIGAEALMLARRHREPVPVPAVVVAHPSPAQAPAPAKPAHKPVEEHVERPAPPPVPAAAESRRQARPPRTTRVEPPPGATAIVIERTTPSFPREAINQGVDSGIVSARLHIDSAGAVKEVQIRESRPSRVFDRETVHTLQQWRFNAGADNRTHDVEITFRR